MSGILEEIGFADAVLAHERDGELVLLDGHLRWETSAESDLIPVLVLDVTEEEADKILATHDPLCEMAEADWGKLMEISGDISFDAPQAQEMIDHSRKLFKNRQRLKNKSPERIPSVHEIIVECDGPETQEMLFEELEGRGLKCRLATMTGDDAQD